MSKFNMHVKTIIRNEEDKILLICENRDDRKDRWDLPGAPLTEDQSFDDALVRRVQKQTGFYVYPREIIGITNYTQYNSKNLTVILDSIILNGHLGLSSDYVDYKWIDLSEISKYPLSQWLNNYIKTTKNPFHDIEDVIDELDDRMDVREAMIEENIASRDSNAFEDSPKKVGRSLKSSFGLFKDAIKRTFHPKRAEVNRTEPKENLYIQYETPEDEMEYEGVFSQEAEDFINKTFSDDEIIIKGHDIDDDDVIFTDNHNNYPDDIVVDHSDEEIVVNHDIETIIEPDSSDMVDDVGILSDNSSDEIVISHDDDSVTSVNSIDVDDVSINAEVEASNDEHVNNSKFSIKDHKVKVISENQAIPYIRKEKESEEKVSFNSEGINRHNWKDKLNEFNRTKANDKKKHVPHPKGKRQ